MARPRSVDDEVVLDAVRVVLAQVGPAGLTLAAVGKVAGLAPATLVQRFGSKRGLLLASAERSADMVRRAYAEAEEALSSPLAAFYAAATNSVAHITTAEEIGNGMGFVQLDLSDPDFRPLAQAHSQAIVDGGARLLRAAVAAGELRPDTDITRVGRVAFAMFHGAPIAWGLLGEGSLPTYISDQFDQLLAPYRT